MLDDTPVLRWLEGYATDLSLLEGTDLHHEIRLQLRQYPLRLLLGDQPEQTLVLVRHSQLTLIQLMRFRRAALRQFLVQPCFASFLSDIRLLQQLGFDTLGQRLQLLVLQEALRMQQDLGL